MNVDKDLATERNKMPLLFPQSDLLPLFLWKATMIPPRKSSSMTSSLLYFAEQSLQCVGAPSFEISAGILSIPNVLLEFMAEINSWRLIKSLHDRLFRDLLESRFFNCGRPLALCRAAFSPAISEAFLVFDQVRSVRRQQGGAP